MAEGSRRVGSGGGAGAVPAAGIRASYYEEKKSVSGMEEVQRAKKVVLKSADMKEEMQKEAINCAISAFDKFTVEKDIAEQIKKDFDKNHGPTWHCIVGKNFGNGTYPRLQLSRTQAHTLRMKQTISYISIWSRRQFCCLNPGEFDAKGHGIGDLRVLPEL